MSGLGPDTASAIGNNREQKLSPRLRPCPSCPYRADCPSGIWHPEEYAKLPGYDGEIADQARAGATGIFRCHNTPDQICAGWLGTHGPENLLALRMNGDRVDPSTFDFVAPTGLHRSGTEAAEHGMRDVDAPSSDALTAIAKISTVRDDLAL